MKTISLIRNVLLLVFTSVCVATWAQPITTPPSSPSATISQSIGISRVTVKYSRPSVKDRAVWGQLVPYGWNAQGFGAGKEAPWRAGANENTTLELSHDAKIEGQPVPKGTYGLFFVINADNTGEVVLSKDNKSWGSFWYEPTRDQLRAKIQIRDVAHTELLTYDVVNPTRTGAELVLNWEKKQFPVKIEFAVDEIVMANAVEELKGPTGFNAQGFTSAAGYALANRVNLEQASTWIDQAITMNPTFNAKRIKAGLLRANQKADEAEKTLKDAIAVATEAELNGYGYLLLGQGQHDKAIEILAMNTVRFPRSANAWDSLGEAYATKGDKDNAIKNFKKCLSLNPPANVKANSEKFLKQFGAM